ncbi:hypothetical protein ACIRSS_07365 [Amycolatopsis sp. NPDC101161]|uniref:hypothetical protein n=1 Tax=Amycolatopsis sp. NPDC101161 TaxID=3363940 RepID=UPI0037F3CE58
MSDDDLSPLWQRQWPECRPFADELKLAYRDRWVRFHSLPESQRYAGRRPWRPDLVDDLLRAAADDGGSDVLLPAIGEHDDLKHRHTDWLSVHPSGF